MEFLVKVDLWRRGNRRRGEVVDLPESEGLALVKANILEPFREDTPEVTETPEGTETSQGISEETENTAETPEGTLPRPNRSANTAEWAAYAESLGIPSKGHSRAELIALTDNN